MAAGVLDQPVTTEEVDLEGRKAKEKMERLITSIVKAM
jgi:purine nucleoside phosphorylase